MNRNRPGISRVGVAVVLTLLVLGMGGGLAFFVKQVQFKARVETQMRLKMLATGALVAEGFNHNRLPPVWGAYGVPTTDSQELRQANLLVHLLPYTENKALFDSKKFEDGLVFAYLSPMDPSLIREKLEGVSSFVGNLRAFSDYGGKVAWDAAIDDLSKCGAMTSSSENMPDGAANVFFFSTKYSLCNGSQNKYAARPDSKEGPFFGAGNYAGSQQPRSEIDLGTNQNLPPFQVEPAFANCNNEAGLYGQSMAGAGLVVVMGDSSSRVLSLTINGDMFAKYLCPSDGQGSVE